MEVMYDKMKEMIIPSTPSQPRRHGMCCPNKNSIIYLPLPPVTQLSKNKTQPAN